jgi:hypothetical protein
MRFVYGVLCILMLLFAVFQYNDPDGPVWMVIYGVPAIWSGIAALRPDWLVGRTSLGLFLISLATSAILTLMLWPPVPGWWHEEVWSMSNAIDGPVIAEKSREGMGLMIATAVMLLVGVASLMRNRRPAQPDAGVAASSRRPA